jgi:hypothetical protein
VLDPARHGNQPSCSCSCVAADIRVARGRVATRLVRLARLEVNLGHEEEARGGAREATVACPAAGRGHPARRLQRARQEEATGSKREAAAVSFRSVTVYLHVEHLPEFA